MIRLFEALARPLVLRALLFLVAAGLLAGFDYGGVVARLAEIVPALASPTGQGVGPWLVIAGLAALVVVNFWLLSHLPFRLQAVIVWIELMGLFLAFCWSFRLSYGFMLQRAPILLGLQLHDGFIQGAALTLFICLVSITLSTVIALAAALARLSDSGPAYGLATFYTSFFRGTPLLLQTMLIYLGLPQLGLVIDAIPAGIIALSLCYGAYMAEIFRAGILSVPRGQSEAARSLGLKSGEVTWLVVLPQAMRLIIPPTGNQFIAMLKDSSLVSVMGVWEIMFLARTHGRAEFKYMEMLIVAALIYWAMSAVFELVQARIEKRFGKGVSVR
ncbi:MULTISPECIES: amino acid ABC transporter permease [unclassified Inquilinus]|uniref:amino acid ABC transporter permease n=1 Tax=unclassified Inquilinus TaxID=2645927 RepID=UPI003F9314BB